MDAESTELDFTSLESALATLQVGIAAHKDAPEDLFIRDACIQRFEYTFELSHKMLRRFLKATDATPSEIDQLSFADLIRTGYARALLNSSWDVWKSFRTARNVTSHAYDSGKAEEVFAIIPRFIDEVVVLLERLNAGQRKL